MYHNKATDVRVDLNSTITTAACKAYWMACANGHKHKAVDLDFIASAVFIIALIPDLLSGEEITTDVAALINLLQIHAENQIRLFIDRTAAVGQIGTGGSQQGGNREERGYTFRPKWVRGSDNFIEPENMVMPVTGVQPITVQVSKFSPPDP